MKTFAWKSSAQGFALSAALSLLWMALPSLAPCLARAQVLQISGGDSSLYQASGGSLVLRSPGYTATVGGGLVAGQVRFGSSVDKQVGSATYLAGDHTIDFLLPTDVFDANHPLFARGLGMANKRAGQEFFTFVGTTSTFNITPVFEGSSSGPKMGFFSFHDQLSPQFRFYSYTLISKGVSQIEALQWKPAHDFTLAGSAGLGSAHPYAAASLNLERKRIDITASYVAAGIDFRRVIVTSPLQAEPDKANLLVNLKPWRRISFSGGTQSFLVPSTGTTATEQSSVRNASTYLELLGTMFTGTVYDSSAEGVINRAAAFTASRDFGPRMKVSSNYMISKPLHSTGTSSNFSTLSEVLNAHIGLNESISISNGQANILYGGSLLTNLLTVSASWETFYVPVHPQSPFQNSLLLDVRFHFLGSVNLHGATFVGPTGKLLYTTDVNTVIARNESDKKPSEEGQIENYAVRGLVVDTENRPIEGAALMIDARPVFTDSSGNFVVRERRPHEHKLSVLTDQFLDGGQWEVVTVPQWIDSSSEANHPPTVIVVRRVEPAAAGRPPAVSTSSNQR